MFGLAMATTRTCADIGPDDPLFDGCFWRAFFLSPVPASLLALVAALVYCAVTLTRLKRAQDMRRRASGRSGTIPMAERKAMVPSRPLVKSTRSHQRKWFERKRL